MRLVAGAAAVALAAAATLMGAGPVAARQSGEPNVALEVSPTSGPPGTVITVQGEDCAPTEPPGLIAVLVFVSDATTQLAGIEVHPDAGSWSAQLTVPQEVDPDEAITVTADCGVFNCPDCSLTLDFSYEPAAFDVIGPTTTAPPTTTPPTPAGPAPPAQPVVAEPTFTG